MRDHDHDHEHDHDSDAAGAEQQRRRAWQRYWQNGPLHCLPGGDGDGDDDGLSRHWAAVFAPLRDGQRMLDIGTGNGALPALLLQLRPQARICVDAIDLAQPAPAWLAAQDEPVRRRLRMHGGVRAESLPFEDAVFDLAVSQFGIEYSTHAASIGELSRVLASGGRCALVLHHAGSHLHAVAGDEVAAAEMLLGEGGLLDAAAALLPWLQLAAEGQLQRLRGEARANHDRSAFNAALQGIDNAIDTMHQPQLLIDARHWIGGMNQALMQRQVDAAKAARRLAEYRQDIALARLRSAELIDHALDAAALQGFARLLADAGLEQIDYGPLQHRGHLVGWQLQARKR